MSSLYTWGRNGNGQLGHGGKQDAHPPKLAPTSQKLTKAQCAHFHSAALSAEGAVYSWGRGALGLLGHGEEEDHEQPHLVSGLQDVTVQDLGCGSYHTAVVTSSGEIQSWGWALVSEGEQVEETFHVSPVPVLLVPATRITGIACGCYATAAWSEEGKLLTWGRGGSGQLGHGGCEDEVAPRVVEALAMVHAAKVTLGGMQELGFMVVLGADGSVYSCGAEERGRLGREAERGTPHHTPGRVTLSDAAAESAPPATYAVEVAASDHHAAAVTHSGALYVWGSNEFGRIGLPQAGEVATPTRVESLAELRRAGGAEMRCVGVACAAYTTAVLLSSGAVYTMGGRAEGAATPESMAMPALLELPEGAAAIAGGGSHLAALVGGAPKQPPAPGAAVPLPEALKDLVSDGLGELLLADCGGAPAPQVKHELKMLRELLAAEQRKLDALKPKQGEANRDELSLKLAELGRAKS
jgi:alpha-tubulin suppressor-like RCC1 family protein